MIFSESENTYFLKASNLQSPEELFSGLWLVMAGVDDIPPHIALINEGKYFSVSAKKVDVDTPLENFLKAIGRKNIPTIFLQLKQVPLTGGSRGASRFFSSYPTLGNGNHSCLWPVRDFFASTFDKKYSSATLVFELLKMAQEDGLLLECKALFVPESILTPPRMGRPGGATLPKYTHDQIREKINSILKINE